MSKKFHLMMVLVLVVGLFGGLLTASTVSADPVPGRVIELPRIDIGAAFGGTGWDTRIQVQNVGLSTAYVVAFFWGGYSNKCPSNNPPPIGHACMIIPYNGVWTLHNQIPSGAKSAILYSFATQTEFNTYCRATGWSAGLVGTGPRLAVTVDRWGNSRTGFKISSSYTGVADPLMTGPGYQYFAPYVMHGYNDLDTVITIQNSGDACTSIWIYYKKEDNCEFMKAQHIELLAPGESVTVGPSGFANYAFPTPELKAPWLGSAYVTANEQLAIIVDQVSLTGIDQGTLLSWRGRPYLADVLMDETRWYADLLYRETSGWTSSIQVQNLTIKSMPTFVTVDFFDNSGDEIFFVGDWVCRNGAKTFYLPAIIDLGINYPFGYVGAAEIESHQQVDYPGVWHPSGEPIFAVVDIKKTKMWNGQAWVHAAPGEIQGGAYNAHPYYEKVNAYGWAMPHIAKEQAGVTSRIAIRNNSNCNKIAGKVLIKDETGRVVATIDVPWLQPKKMKIIDLAYFGQIAPGFLGAAEFLVGSWRGGLWYPDGGVEQLCDVDNNGHVDNEPIMPSVVVLNYGWQRELPAYPGGPSGEPGDDGDLTRVYEGIPYLPWGKICYGDIFGDVYMFDYSWDTEFPRIDPEANEPIVGADVVVDTGQSDVTSNSGGYELIRVPAGDRTVTASKCGYFDWSEDVALECGADTKVDLLLVCKGIVWGTVLDDATGTPLKGVLMTLDVDCKDLDRQFHAEATTNSRGVWWMEVPLCGDWGEADAPWTLTKTMAGYSTVVKGWRAYHHLWDFDMDGEQDVGEPGLEFASEFGFQPWACVGIGSWGCYGLSFCETPDGKPDPCLSLISENDWRFEWVWDPEGGWYRDWTNAPERLISSAYIQGRTYCDGLVSDNDVFDVGEEQPNTLVRLYRANTAGDATTFMEEQRSNAIGFYQFVIDLDRDKDGVVEDTENDFRVVANPASEPVIDLASDVHAVRNLNVCP